MRKCQVCKKVCQERDSGWGVSGGPAELGQRSPSPGKAWPLPPANARTVGPTGDIRYAESIVCRTAGQTTGKALGTKNSYALPQRKPLKTCWHLSLLFLGRIKETQEKLYRGNNFYLISEKKQC